LDNPRLRFLTFVKMNNEVVSKGYGPNKKESKTSAVLSLLKIICPNIYEEWQEKLKTHVFNINPGRPNKNELEKME